MTDIEKRLRRVLADWLDDPETRPGTVKLADDVGCDSLDLIEIAMAVEQEFDIEISDDDSQKWVAGGAVLQDLLDLVTRLGPT